MLTDKSLIVLYDGDCNLCNSSISFIVRHDIKKRFGYHSIQSDGGKYLITKHGLLHLKNSTLVFVEKNKAHTKSSAALHIAKYLNGIYPLCSLLLIVPEIVRNKFYDFIAKRRYKWFGKIMPKELKAC